MTITKAASFSNLFFRCISIFSVLFVVSACSYFDTAEPAGGDKIDLTHGGAVIEQGQLASAAPDLLDLANRTSSGSVQVFSLDQPVGASAAAIGAGSSGYRASPVRTLDPNVEIFPLDDAMGRLIPPSNTTSQSWSPVPAVPVEPVEVQRHGSYSPSSSPAFSPVSGAAGRLVYFDHDQTVPDAAVVHEIASAVHTGQRVKVSGHASTQSSISDPIARKIVNLRVSMERAFFVAKSLIERGVPAESIELAAYGEAFPAQGGVNIDAQSASRRVEITTQ